MVKIGNQRGQTLLEVMVSLGILGGIAVASLEYITVSYKALLRQRMLSSRDRVIAAITQIAGMPVSWRSSIDAHQPENHALNECIALFGTPGDCMAGVYTDFRLYGPFVNASSSSATFQVSGAMTGTTAFPMRYDIEGHPCDTSTDPNGCPSGQYPIQATSQFRAWCHIPAEYNPYGGPGWLQPIYASGPGSAMDYTQQSQCAYAIALEAKITFSVSPNLSGPVGSAFGNLGTFPDYVVYVLVDQKRIWWSEVNP